MKKAFFVLALLQMSLSTAEAAGDACPMKPNGTVSNANAILDTCAKASRANEEDEEPSHVGGKAVRKVSLRKLSQIAWKNAISCRTEANFAAKRKHRRPQRLCGNQTKHKCKEAVRETLQEAFGITISGSSALQAKSSLAKRFKKIKVKSCGDAPMGAICVYGTIRHPFGHIEIKTDNGLYCSDFCTSRPSDRNKRGKFTIDSVFVPY